MFQRRLPAGERQAADRHGHGRVRSRHIVVVVVPHEHGQPGGVAAGQGGDVGPIEDAPAGDDFERECRIAVGPEPFTAHLAEEAKDVEHGLVEAPAGERTKPGEERLILELEGPGERAFQVHAGLVCQIVFAGEAGCSVARIHRAVAVSQRRALAGRAALRIGLPDDDRLAFEFGKRSHEAKALLDRAEMIRQAHAHVAVGRPRRALGVEGHKIHRRADLAGRIVRAPQAVDEKVPHEFPAAAGDVGTADPGGRQHYSYPTLVPVNKVL